MTALFIAILHAIPILFVGFVSKSRSALNVTTAIMCLVSVVIGSSTFIVSDLIAIGAGYFIVVNFLNQTGTRNFEDQSETRDFLHQSDTSIKYFITMFVSTESGIKTKSTNTFASVEHAESVLSDILKERLAQDWNLKSFSHDEVLETKCSAISMVQGVNPAGAIAVTCAIHPVPVLVSDKGEMLPNYTYLAEQSIDYSGMADSEQSQSQVFDYGISQTPEGGDKFIDVFNEYPLIFVSAAIGLLLMAFS